MYLLMLKAFNPPFRFMNYHLLLASLLLIATLFMTITVAQLSYVNDGYLDKSFGQNGFASTSWSWPGLHDVHIEPDGTVFSVTSTFAFPTSSILITKHLPNGTIDTRFDESGYKTISVDNLSVYGTALAIQTDGKILIGGYTGSVFGRDFVVFRLLSNGDIDNQFGAGGFVIIDVPPRRNERETADRIGSINILSDGKILTSGISEEIYGSPSRYDIYSVLCRLNPDGSLDNSFGNLGLAKTQISAGYSPGALLPAAEAEVMTDGRIVVSAYTEVRPIHNSLPIYPRRFFLRYRSDGSLDTTFDQDGIADTSLPWSRSNFTVASDGKVLYTGHSNLQSLFRLNADGSPDTTFGNNGSVMVGWHGITSIAIASDQKILLGGYFDLGDNVLVGKLARYWSDGTPHLRFGRSGVVTVHGEVTDYGNIRGIYFDTISIFQDKYLLVHGVKFSAQNLFVARYIIKRKP